ncbi:hypothetical protein C6I20_09605 [Aeromicrobium sp. A1-2]|uniref:hypothetical protein n=1 Tax=Aeromicrobium sp. A1-2 TaxID=2107713 RepID=UPI000E536BCB|nr:hypothetical protein [Aeromicrobium sp. A1-2]AXT85418.1 hypothetical protein C6I20_09605 [Aeromicrobium sp. A1-2]
MELDEPGWHLLDDFFIAEAADRAIPTVRRYVRVRGRLTYFLDTAEMGDWLGAQSATLLSAEREFHDRGAFWQLFGPNELMCVIPGFLRPPWLPEGLGESRTQISLMSRLLSHLSRQQLLDLSVFRCAYWDAEAAIKQARVDFARRSAARKPDDWASEMPGRFRQEPGPQW